MAVHGEEGSVVSGVWERRVVGLVVVEGGVGDGRMCGRRDVAVSSGSPPPRRWVWRSVFRGFSPCGRNVEEQH